MKKLQTISLAILCTAMIVSCGEKKKEVKDSMDNAMEEVTDVVEEVQQMPTIVSVASSNDSFSTLVAAVSAAELVETLNGTGPFTVFAPTNEAFAKLPAGTVESLLKPENKEKLASILTLHVVSGAFDAAAVIEAIQTNDGSFVVETVQGESLTLTIKDGNVLVTDANGGTATVVIADVLASNGIIHAIDSVVMPKS